jgi:hypothetical protein
MDRFHDVADRWHGRVYGGPPVAQTRGVWCLVGVCMQALEVASAHQWWPGRMRKMRWSR